jgi:hypothetical protein
VTAAQLFRRPQDAPIAWQGASGLGIEERFEAESLRREVLVDRVVPASEILAEAKALVSTEITMRWAKKALGVEAGKDGYTRAWQRKFPLIPTSIEGYHVTRRTDGAGS